MTDEILVAYERAARILCGKMGVDPDEMLPVPSQTVLGSSNLVPQWHFAAVELHAFSLRLVSLKEAATEPKVAH